MTKKLEPLRHSPSARGEVLPSPYRGAGGGGGGGGSGGGGDGAGGRGRAGSAGSETIRFMDDNGEWEVMTATRVSQVVAENKMLKVSAPFVVCVCVLADCG